MAETAREYLIHRFRGDAQALRSRCEVLQRGTKVPGPDLPTSRQMASACDTVVGLLEAIAPHQESAAGLSALVALIPVLEQHARGHAASPPVRAVFAGAATRIREVEAVEQRAAPAAADAGDADDGDADDGDADDGDANDDRVAWAREDDEA